MIVGYSRVSTEQQETASQRDAFERAGVLTVFEEKRSAGAGSSRPVLEEMLCSLKRGDVLAVYKIDRLARSLVDLLRILDRLTPMGVEFRSLTDPLETVTPVGRLMLQLLGSVAEFERAVIRERCEAGRRAARDRGVRFGRPLLLGDDQARAFAREGLSVAEVSRRAGISRAAVDRSLKRSGVRLVDGRRARTGV